MSKDAASPLRTMLEAVGVRCRTYHAKFKPSLAYVTPADLRPKLVNPVAGGIIWVESWYGEAHVGDMVVVAKIAPVLRAANMRAVFITNPSFGPLVNTNSDVLTALPHTGNEALIEQTLKNATHMTSWSHLWHCAKTVQPDIQSFSTAVLDHDPFIAAGLRGTYRQNMKPLIGICWRTALIGRDPARNSSLNSWQSLLDNKNYNFLSLQYGSPDLARQEIVAARKQGWAIEHDDRIDTINDLPRYAAQIAACDLVVSIDCSTAYMAAGLGVRTMTLLSTAALESWGTEKACPFFPNNSIFRQVEPNGWNHPIGQASREACSVFELGSALGTPRLLKGQCIPDL